MAAELGHSPSSWDLTSPSWWQQHLWFWTLRLLVVSGSLGIHLVVFPILSQSEISRGVGYWQYSLFEPGLVSFIDWTCLGRCKRCSFSLCWLMWSQPSLSRVFFKCSKILEKGKVFFRLFFGLTFRVLLGAFSALAIAHCCTNLTRATTNQLLFCHNFVTKLSHCNVGFGASLIIFKSWSLLHLMHLLGFGRLNHVGSVQVGIWALPQVGVREEFSSATCVSLILGVKVNLQFLALPHVTESF